MAYQRFIDNNEYHLGTQAPLATEHILTFDLGAIRNVISLDLIYKTRTIVFGLAYSISYSYDGVTYTQAISTLADQNLTRRILTPIYNRATTQHIYLKIQSSSAFGSDPSREISIQNFELSVYDGIPNSLSLSDTNYSFLPVASSFTGYSIQDIYAVLVFPHIITQVEGGDTGGGGSETPTSQNLINGNVKKLNLPFEANVVAVSIETEPKVLAQTKSDPVTGDYQLDVYPHIDELLIYVAPDYGRALFYLR